MNENKYGSSKKEKKLSLYRGVLTREDIRTQNLASFRRSKKRLLNKQHEWNCEREKGTKYVV